MIRCLAKKKKSPDMFVFRVSLCTNLMRSPTRGTNNSNNISNAFIK